MKPISDRNVCEACDQPQPLSSSEDYYSVFGLERRLGLDRAELERSFYRLSRALHPDRFTTGSPEAQRLSLERMTFLNKAYQVLKQPDSRREYLLELEGLKGMTSASQGRVPMELAEGWFELQETLAEDPSRGVTQLAQFESELQALKLKAQEYIKQQDEEIDRALIDGGSVLARPLLERLTKSVQEQSYLASMERDIERIKSKLP